MKLLDLPRRLLLARTTVLSLIGLLTMFVLVGTVIPQRFNTTAMDMARWREDNPLVAASAGLLGFDHVYTSVLFTTMLVVFILSLSFSSLQQIHGAWRKTTGLQLKPSAGKGIQVSLPAPEVVARAKRRGYREIGKDKAWTHMIKNPSGYWGIPLLHAGIWLVVVTALFIVLTQKRGVIQLSQGEVFPAGAEWDAEELGIAAGLFFLPNAVRLDLVQPEFWETDDLKQQKAVISFLQPDRKSTTYELQINRTVYHNGIRVDQSSLFGHTFFVIFTDANNKQYPLRLDFEYPLRKHLPSYNTFRFQDIPYLIRGKYYADALKRKMDGDNPLLTLRLEEFDKVKGEVSLTKGEQGRLGDYNVALITVSKWTRLVFTDIKGMNMMFFGFFIIILGSWLIYGLPPREITVKMQGNGCNIWWKPGKFGRFYSAELLYIINNE